MSFLLNNKDSTRLTYKKVSRNFYTDWLPFFEDPSTRMYWETDLESPEKECEKWFLKQEFRCQNNLGGMNALIEKTSNKLVGHAGLLIQELDGKKELEVAYSLLPTFWNKGYATEAAKTCRDFAFNKELSTSLISIISVTNIPSRNVALKNGMLIHSTTLYNNNKVHIYRINHQKWLSGFQ